MRARQLVTQSAVPAFAVDEKNRIVAWNDKARESFGLAPQAVLGRNSGDVLEIRDANGNRACPRNCAFHSMAQRGEKIAGYVLQIKGAGGDLLPIYGSAEVVKAEGTSSYEIVFFVPPERRQLTVDAALERLLHRRLANELSSLQGHGPGPPDLELTARQQQVLRLLATGKTTASIARALGVSLNTIRHHMQNILDNLDCHSQAEAVAKAIRHDLI